VTLAPYIQPRRQNLSIQERLKQIRLSGFWSLAGASVANQLYGGEYGPGDLTAVNTPTSAVGPSSNIPLATHFTAASSQSMTLTARDQLYMGLQSRGFTLAVWAYFDTAGTVLGIVGFDDGVNRNWRLIKTAANVLQMLIYNGTTQIGGAISISTVTTATWYRIVVRATATKTEIWVNGALFVVAAETYASQWGSAIPTFRVGNDAAAAGRFMNGRLAQLIISHRPWTDGEIQWDYNAGQGRSLERGC
jgi:hypothetical protein